MSRANFRIRNLASRSYGERNAGNNGGKKGKKGVSLPNDDIDLAIPFYLAEIGKNPD